MTMLIAIILSCVTAVPASWAVGRLYCKLIGGLNAPDWLIGLTSFLVTALVCQIVRVIV